MTTTQTLTRTAGIAGYGALVTGAGRGIGAAVARALAEQGARVALFDLDPDGLREQAAAATTAGHTVRTYSVDVRATAEVDRAVEHAERDLGPIDILVNVAGVLRTGPTVDMADEDWEAVFAVNAEGVMRVSRALARRMIPRGQGRIVTVSSNAAGVPRANMAAYAASKAAATQFTKSLALELAPHGIRCNVVAPGSTETDMLRSMWTADHGAAHTIQGTPEEFRIGIPLRKLATPCDVASAVVFLVSDGASHITLQELYVDGGAALRP
jgi:2,3-dihydro-2,3-dihydroxybenzoate dehydrogenase